MHFDCRPSHFHIWQFSYAVVSAVISALREGLGELGFDNHRFQAEVPMQWNKLAHRGVRRYDRFLEVCITLALASLSKLFCSEIRVNRRSTYPGISRNPKSTSFQGWNPVRLYFQELGRGWVPASAGTTMFLEVPIQILAKPSEVQTSPPPAHSPPKKACTQPAWLG